MSLITGISGVRGVVGQTLDEHVARRLAAAYGSHLQGGDVVLGRDTRASGASLAAAAEAGLQSAGCRVFSLGIASTPATAFMIGSLRSAGGVVITASHNPAQWNGLKLLTREGFAPPPDVAEEVFERFRAERFAPKPGRGVELIENAAERHVEQVVSVSDVATIQKERFKVVLDSVNGAGGGEGRRLLERLGCEVVHVNGEPSGEFAHTPEPTAENLTGLCEEVRRRRADLGFAQDPDADRLAIVDETGRYIGEEYTLALSARFMLADRPGPLAANLSTSRMIDDLAAAVGVKVYRTPVGEAHVARAVLAHRCVLGGEGNGGIIDPRVVCVRDSLVGMALVLGLLADERRPLSRIVDSMPRYVMVKRKFEMDRPSIAAWLARVRQAVARAKVDESDGLRIDWPEGWVHVRPSNTEPIARVIAEAADAATAEALAERVAGLRG